jgi:ectoine hydroxylase-related dioxygenase (phytanoyl-CoA dioxygenase family)
MSATAALRETGCVVVPGVLSESELEQGRALLDALYAAFDPEVDPAGIDISAGKAGDALREASPTVNWASNLASKSPFFRDLTRRQPVRSLVESVLGDDIALSSLNSLEPLHGQGHQTLHRDEGPVGPEGPVVVNTLWVFDDMDRSNGATRYVPGTQHGDDLVGDDDPRVLYAEVPAGSVIVMNAHMLHGASTNRDGRRRRVVHVYFTRRGRPVQTDWRRYVPAEVRSELSEDDRRLLGLEAAR